jgi:hypothetical protein
MMPVSFLSRIAAYRRERFARGRGAFQVLSPRDTQERLAGSMLSRGPWECGIAGNSAAAIQATRGAARLG